MLSAETVEKLMRIAMEEADLAIADGDSPFGAVIVDADGNLIARAHNRENSDLTDTSHAEINAMRMASQKLGTKRLHGCILISNAEPCSMCASAIIKSGMREVYYGADMEPHCNPYLTCKEVAKYAHSEITIHSGILKEECTNQIKNAR